MSLKTEKGWNRMEDLFEQCLAAVRHDGQSIEECLSHYPKQRAELEPLLRTAVRLETARTLQASPQLKARVRQRLQAVAAAKSQTRKSWGPLAWLKTHTTSSPAPVPQRPLVSYALAGLLLVVLITLGFGTIYASAQALPGDILYPVKRAKEDLQLNLTTNVVDRAHLHLVFADRRMTEAMTLFEQERTSSLEKTLADFNSSMQTELAYMSTGSDLTPAQQSELADKVLKEVTRYETNLTAMIPETSTPAQSNLETALSTSRKAYNQAITVLNSQNGVTPAAPGLAPSPSATPVPSTETSTATHQITRVKPSVTYTASRQPSTGNIPDATATKSVADRATATPIPIKTTPTIIESRTPSTNLSGAPTATQPPTDNEIKPTATLRTAPDLSNITPPVTDPTP